MNCRDAERLIDTFFDGELEGRLMREAALHVTRCKRCEAEIVDREQVHDLLGAAIDDDLAAMDVGRIWTGVEAAIADVAQRPGREQRASLLRPAQWFRLAAASTRSNGVVVGRGRRGATLAQASRVASDDELDPTGQWLRPESSVSRRGTWSLAAVTAIAASLVAAVLLTRGDAPTGTTVASAPDATPSIGAVAMVNPPASQVKVESVDYSGRSLAMWTEPETDTTVIWVDDEEPGAPK